MARGVRWPAAHSQDTEMVDVGRPISFLAEL